MHLDVSVAAPPRTVRVPWPLTAALILALAVPVTRALQDLRGERVLTQAQQADDEGRFDDALALYRAAGQLNPQDAAVALAHAQAARTLWYYRDDAALRREADDAFGRASALSPHWSMPHYRHARMYAFKGQYTRALELLAPALQLDPNNAGYWLEQARYLAGAAQGKTAQAAYARCWALDQVQACNPARRAP